MLFQNRRHAGGELAGSLRHLRGSDVVVAALPRGGVPVAFEVAKELSATLDVIVVRKLGLPSRPELAIGAVGEGGVCVIDEKIVGQARLSDREIDVVKAREQDDVDRRVLRFRSNRRHVPIADRVVVVVDDGIATGATARAACQVARARGAARVVLAAPVVAPGALRGLRDYTDEIVYVEAPEQFSAVGQFYADFSQTSDDEVLALLEEAVRSIPQWERRQ